VTARKRTARRKPARRARAATIARAAPTGRTAAILKRLRAICLALPEAAEKVSHGEPTWFAGKGKVFAMFDDHHHGAPHVSVWLPAPEGVQRVLVANDPKRFWRPPYVGAKGWVAVVLDTAPDWALVADLVEQAYRQVATAKLLARLGDA
jgi:hypothetical protein